MGREAISGHDTSEGEFVVQPTLLTYGGDAMARLPDGRAVFTPFVLPGETVRVRVVEEKAGHVRAAALEVLEPAPARIAPRCPHFTFCGGCHYQHLSYADQLTAKQSILREQLVRLGGFSGPPVAEIIPSPTPWNYRNHVQFHLTPEGKLGYQAPDSHHVIPIRECHLPEEALDRLWPALEFEPGAELERVGLRLGAGEDVLVALEGQDPNGPEFSVDFPLSAVYRSPAGQIVLSGDDHIIMEVMERAFRVSAGSFFQVNTAQAAALVQRLLGTLDLSPQSTLVDVYCGVGLFSAFLAPKVQRLAGIELAESACADFAANLDEFDNVELYQGSAEDVLPNLDLKPDVLLADPPRAGLGRKVVESILALQPAQIAYVSCDPATLARDLKRLAGAGYRLEQVIPFDLFPQTYHIESISFLDMRS